MAAESPFENQDAVEETPPTSGTQGSPFFDEDAVEEEIEELDEQKDEKPDEETDTDEEEKETDEKDSEELSEEELDELIDEILSDEDSDEEDSDEKSEEKEEDETDTATVPHAALHKERMRRKELQGTLEQMQLMTQEAYTQADSYKQALDKVMSQLDELGVKDLVKVEMPEGMSEEKMQQLQHQQMEQQQNEVLETITSLRQEALMHIDEFPAINPKDAPQGELVLGYALAATQLGQDPEEAILKGLSILNQNIATAKKKAVRSKPVKKKSAPQRKQRRSSIPKNQKDVRNIFDGLADDMLG